MPSTMTPSAVCTAATGRASPSSAPPIELAEASTASGKASRRLASPPRISIGAAASALASATSRPAPRTKSRWKGKKPPMIGTNSVPPPMPAGTATMPIRKQATNSAAGHTHHGVAATAPPAACADCASSSNSRPRPAARARITTPPGSTGSAGDWPARRRTSARPAGRRTAPRTRPAAATRRPRHVRCGQHHAARRRRASGRHA